MPPPNSPSDPSQPGVSLLRLSLGIGLFAILGIPLVAIVWETLNKLLALEADPRMLTVASIALLILAALLYALAKQVRRLNASKNE